MYHPRQVSRSRVDQIRLVEIVKDWLWQDSDIRIQRGTSIHGSVWWHWECSGSGSEKLSLIYALARAKPNRGIKDPQIRDRLLERITCNMSRY